MFYLLNAFSPNMLPRKAAVTFSEITRGEAVALYKKHEKEVVNAIGHKGTIKVVSNLLFSEIPTSCVVVSLKREDAGIIFTLSFKPEENKIYGYLDLCKLNDEGKIKIHHFKVISEV